jgi:hypothetical protein
MQNWLFGLPGRIPYEKSPWCEIKLWACSWVCSTAAFFGLPWNEHAIKIRLYSSSFPEHLSIRRTFPDICTIFDAVSLSDMLRNHITPDSRFQIKGRKNISTSPQLREILYTDSQDMLVLSSTVASCYYNCCTYGSTSPENYRHPSYIAILICVFKSWANAIWVRV